MKSVLFAWIGMADLKAHGDRGKEGLGPIGQALHERAYSRICLLSDHDSGTNASYVKWLRTIRDVPAKVFSVSLTGPTNFGEIYEHAVKALTEVKAEHKEGVDFVFHLSPGTPAMASVWIILSKTRFPATLIESSLKQGVRTASVPFDISADYLPDLLRKPDEDLVRLLQGLTPEAPEFSDIIHRCAAMKRVVVMARRVAPRSIPVLILGESGTGKELFAKAIHRSSSVKSGPFVAVNCGAIPESLIESELFGHEQGAFTGARNAKPGYLELANGGTLFLDEVGELPAYAQVKLLRVLQDGQVFRIGATRPRTTQFRLIAATNRNLLLEVAERRFREDLFHRIAVAVLKLPPLREREGDVGLVLDALLARINQEAEGQPGYAHKKLSVSAKKLLVAYPWPGNIRELTNTLQRAAVWSTGPTIDTKDVEDAILPLPKTSPDAVLGHTLGEGFSLKETMTSIARHYLERAMKQAGGNKTRAARLLGLSSYQTLSNWLQRYGLSFPADE